MDLSRRSVILDTGWIMQRHGRVFVIIAIAVCAPQWAVSYLLYSSAESIADPEMRALLLPWTWVPITVISISITALVEIHWHRILILGERHRTASYFRFDTRWLHYTSIGLLLWAVVVSPRIAAAIFWEGWATSTMDDASLVSLFYRLNVACETASIALSLLLATLLGPIFSAVAIGRQRSSFTDILRMTRGNRRRIAGAYFLGFETWSICASIFWLIYLEHFTGYGAWDVALGAFDIYMELERQQALESFGSTFD